MSNIVTLEDKHVAIVIAPENFRDEEYAHPHAALNLAGAQITVVSTIKGKCYGKLGSIAHSQMTIDDALSETWDAVVFIGGSGAEIYVDDPRAHQLARTCVSSKKPLAAICMAPIILAHAGLLDGVEATVYPSPEDEAELIRHGAILTHEAVTESFAADGKTPIITANGPQSAMAFGQSLVNCLRAPLDPWQ